ncbi:hypothetical protein W02_32140 [Nitrospira sp. KM1]|nr:hypothetical protein W02_32140 [Nitrospira sp. KM1]
MYAKAGLAQYLLQRAWSRSLAGERAVRPWPWADTWPIARLTVPSRHIDLIILNGAYGRTLAFGPGYLESSAFPGTNGTTVLTGHRDTHFGFLKDLHRGDRVILESTGGEIRSYQVMEHQILDQRTGRVGIERERSILILVTCYPFDSPSASGPLRYVVTAVAGKPP